MQILKKWDQSCAIGHTDIDRDHRELFDLIAMISEYDKKGEREFVVKIIRTLEIYANRHFSLEEGILEIAGYTGLQSHKHQHHSFIKQVKEFKKKYNEKENLDCNEITRFLNSWLINHILVTDKAYQPYIQYCLTPTHSAPNGDKKSKIR